MIKAILAIILALTVQTGKIDKAPKPIPADHSTELRIQYDAALRAEYEFKLAEERYRSAKQRMDVSMERYQGALSAARKAAGAPDNALVNGPIFTEFFAPKDSQNGDKAPSKQ